MVYKIKMNVFNYTVFLFCQVFTAINFWAIGKNQIVHNEARVAQSVER